MAGTVEAITGAVFVKNPWDSAALRRAVAALGLVWPE